MESIESARATILGCASPLDAEEVPLAEAAGRVLAEDVRAAHDVPPFANSAMDGFALVAPGGDLALIGESRAGAPFAGMVRPCEAVRISTGAALPEGADAVVPIEHAEVSGDRVLAESPAGA